MKNAVVLLSGGLDSATVLAMAVSQGWACSALSFDYGQRHAREVAAAAAIARHYRVKRHVTLKIDLRAFGGSALTSEIAVPKDQWKHETRNTKHETEGVIPVTYVPARNTVFLAFALAFAETAEARDIFIGVNAVDYSGYPDCRPVFIEAFEKLANLGTRAGVEGGSEGGSGGGAFHVHAPLIRMSKAEIIRTGLALRVPYGLTHSCYDPLADGRSCGHCDSCLIRRAGFREAGAVDPAAYAS